MNNTTLLIKELRQATGASILDCKQALLSHNSDYEQAMASLRQKSVAKAAKKAERQTTEGLIVIKANENSVCAVELNCETDFVALTPDFKLFTHNLAEIVLADPSLTDAVKLETAVFTTAPHQTVHEAIQVQIGKLGENIQLGHVARYTATDTTVLHGYAHAGAISGYESGEGRFGVLIELGLANKTAVSPEVSSALAHDLALHIVSTAPKYVSTADIPAAVLTDLRAQMWQQVAAENKPEVIKEKIINGRLHKFYVQNCLLLQPFIKDENLTVEDWLQVKGKEIGSAVSVNRFARMEITP